MTGAQGTKMGLCRRLANSPQSDLRLSGEISANKRKQMKIKESKSTFISFHKFFRIGTFQGVTGDSNKKIFSF